MLDHFHLVPTTAKAVTVGQRYGRLTVVATGQLADNRYKYYAVCQCDCGSALKRIRFDGLTNGVIVSCGCYHAERIKTHGLHSSPHYSRWRNMIDRCNNPDCPAYPDYGARGIKVCDRWYDIKNYVADLPPGYFDGAHLDRIDNDGNYEPGNVRWVTPKRNHNNRRTTVMLSHDGRTMSMTDWSHETGLSISVIWSRINEHGWTVEQALTTPTLDKHERMRRAREKRNEGKTPKPKSAPREIKTVEFYGAHLSLKQLSVVSGIPEKKIRKRILERGWDVYRAVAAG